MTILMVVGEFLAVQIGRFMDFVDFAVLPARTRVCELGFFSGCQIYTEWAPRNSSFYMYLLHAGMFQDKATQFPENCLAVACFFGNAASHGSRQKTLLQGCVLVGTLQLSQTDQFCFFLGKIRIAICLLERRVAWSDCVNVWRQMAGVGFCAPVNNSELSTPCELLSILQTVCPYVGTGLYMEVILWPLLKSCVCFMSVGLTRNIHRSSSVAFRMLRYSASLTWLARTRHLGPRRVLRIQIA